MQLHASLAQAAAFVFHTLQVGVTLRHGDDWHAIHTASSVLLFEFAHGVDMDRLAYNRRNIARVRRERKTLLGQHAGFFDLCVPMGTDEVEAVLLTGPFANRRPTSAEVSERWQFITGRHGHPSDPEFAHYLTMTLATLTLEGDQVGRYQRFLECYAKLSSGKGDAETLFAEAKSLGATLERSRAAEGMWDAAREMVDERTSGVWLSPQVRGGLRSYGLSRLPEYVVVCLPVGKRDEADPVDEILRRDAFQRAAVDLARSRGAMCGRVGDHGVMFLVNGGRSVTKTRAAVADLAFRASALARRRFGFSLHVGTSSLSGDASLGSRYEQALAAAERALSEGVPVVHADTSSPRRVSPLRQLRRHLGAAGEGKPKALPARFERYIEAVGIESGYRLDISRAHLEAGFDEAARSLVSTGALSERAYEDICDLLERAARDAVTITQLVDAYRRAISGLCDLVEHPASATHDRNLDRAVTFVHQHFTEPLTVRQVARIAGFAPAYFGQLFRRRERMTFQKYVRHLRIERAKQLLTGTNLNQERVGQLAGFALRNYFHRAFKLLVGITPQEFRRRRK